MIAYRFLSVAEEEVSESMEFYETRDAGLGLRFQDELSRIVRLLRHSPKIGPPVDDKFRSFPLDKFPFTVVYGIESDSLVIVAVAHHSRKPGYWKSRVS